jgi:hypothetical protein
MRRVTAGSACLVADRGRLRTRASKETLCPRNTTSWIVSPSSATAGGRLTWKAASTSRRRRASSPGSRPYAGSAGSAAAPRPRTSGPRPRTTRSPAHRVARSSSPGLGITATDLQQRAATIGVAGGGCIEGNSPRRSGRLRNLTGRRVMGRTQGDARLSPDLKTHSTKSDRKPSPHADLQDQDRAGL